MYYIYRHVRLDTNEVFYIGKGKKVRIFHKTYTEEYKRAFSKFSRNKYWKNIINKTDYKIEILYESNSSEDICHKEIEFIKLYGRKDLKLGTLVNMTNGGEGIPGRINTKETISKMSNTAKSIMTSERKQNMINRLKPTQFKKGNKSLNSKKVCQYSLDNLFIKTWETMSDASKTLNVPLSKISNCIHEKRKSTGGFKWYLEVNIFGPEHLRHINNKDYEQM